MSTVVKINENTEFETEMKTDGLRFYDSKDKPFKAYGVYHDGEKFRRMPQSLGDTLGGWHVILSRNTAGGRIRLKQTAEDLPFIMKAICVRCPIWHIRLPAVSIYISVQNMQVLLSPKIIKRSDMTD